MTEQIVVVGGGIMGLGVAWRAAERGARVVLLEAGECGREASWAAAGMLAPHAEAEFHEHEQLAMAEQSQRLWPEFVASLEAASGVALDYDATGTLLVARDRDDSEQIQRMREHLVGRGRAVDWLDADAARALEPALSPTIVGAAYCREDRRVDNRAVLAGLRVACERAGAAIRENSRVASITCATGAVTGVVLESGETLAASAVVVAAGAWSRALDGLGARRIPVRPVRGQMLAVQMPHESPLLRHVVRGLGAYLVPRSDGRLIVGATSEERGFERAHTAGGLFTLLEGARELLPGIDELNVHSTWVGFRPASRDHGPILGPTATRGLHFITGHYRNGIQLAPISIANVAGGLFGDALEPFVAPFSPTRFGF